MPLRFAADPDHERQEGWQPGHPALFPHSPDNGFAVLRVKTRTHRDLITVVGHLVSATAGEYIEATGQVRWGKDRRDGPAGERNSPPNPGRPMPNRNAAALLLDQPELG